MPCVLQKQVQRSESSESTIVCVLHSLLKQCESPPVVLYCTCNCGTNSVIIVNGFGIFYSYYASWSNVVSQLQLLSSYKQENLVIKSQSLGA